MSFIVGDEDVATHIARWDPKAVLRLVEKAREMLAEDLRLRRMWQIATDQGSADQDGSMATGYWMVRTLAEAPGITEEGTA